MKTRIQSFRLQVRKTRGNHISWKGKHLYPRKEFSLIKCTAKPKIPKTSLLQGRREKEKHQPHPGKKLDSHKCISLNLHISPFRIDTNIPIFTIKEIKAQES